MTSPIPAARIFVAGHRGMVGAAVCRRLARPGGPAVLTRGREDLDLRDPAAVARGLADLQPDCVVIAAARVGGIQANNTRPAEFIYENLLIAANLIHGAHQAGVQRLLFLGSSCIYPKLAPQPMSEEALLTGTLEPTNEPYAIAKIAGIKLCESYNREHGRDYRSLMPTNLYGPGDNFDLQGSHVLPALMRKFHEAAAAGREEVEVWGTGTPRREFLHVDDLADACAFALALTPAQYGAETLPMRSHLNVGTGEDLSIGELAALVGRVTGFAGRIRFNPQYPDGTPRKLLDVTRMRRLGWQARTPLETGVRQTYEWFLHHHARGMAAAPDQRVAGR